MIKGLDFGQMWPLSSSFLDWFDVNLKIISFPHVWKWSQDRILGGQNYSKIVYQVETPKKLLLEFRSLEIWSIAPHTPHFNQT